MSYSTSRTFRSAQILPFVNRKATSEESYPKRYQMIVTVLVVECILHIAIRFWCHYRRSVMAHMSNTGVQHLVAVLANCTFIQNS